MFKSRKLDVEAKLDAIEATLERLTGQIDTFSQTKQGEPQPRGIALLQSLGITPDRFIQRYFQNVPPQQLYAAMYGGTESLRGRPEKIGLASGLCRQIHFSTDEFRYWMNALGPGPCMHRKYWEWFYICQVLFEHDMLAKGKKGLVFAVGQEPIPALLATYGCEILATDQAEESALESGWVQTGQHTAQVESLFYEHICPRETFFSAVSYRSVDMNAVPSDLEESFDFCWSSCSFEHLGSIEHGLAFVERSLDTLVPGGIAVHTTEYNLSSNDKTLESPGLSIFRRRDIEALAARLTAAGHEVAPFDWSAGPGFAETVVDLPPYGANPHLKLKIMEYDCTSIGMIIRKKAA